LPTRAATSGSAPTRCANTPRTGKLLGAIERTADTQQPKPGAYPAETPMIVGRIEGGEFDEDAREIFVTDSYLRGRVLVFDMDSMKFKRGWAAYGKPLKDIQFDEKAKYDPKVRRRRNSSAISR
jgi:hypothetical protein